MGRQGQLDQDAVDVAASVQRFNEQHQLLLSCLRRQDVFLTVYPALGTVPLLSIRVDLAGGVVPYQDHGQAGAALHPRRRRPDLLLTFFASAFPSIMTADTNQSSFFSGPPGPSPASALWAASRFT